MIRVIFESHATTFDNEADLSSGHNDIDLSPLGIQQAHALEERYQKSPPHAVYCSDMQRAYKTAVIAFSGHFIPIYTDKRLRECDYGDLTQQPAKLVKAQRADRLRTPFPNGESYEQTSQRMKSFLDDLAVRHQDGDTIMIIGHRATQYGLEHWLKGVPLLQAVTDPWSWQPGWSYDLKPV